MRYGSLADKAATLPIPKTVSLKSPKEFHLLGQSTPRLDIPEKVNGSAVFGMDVKRPGMLIARVVRCPVFGGKVESFNGDKAKAIAGVMTMDDVDAFGLDNPGQMSGAENIERIPQRNLVQPVAQMIRQTLWQWTARSNRE